MRQCRLPIRPVHQSQPKSIKISQKMVEKVKTNLVALVVLNQNQLKHQLMGPVVAAGFSVLWSFWLFQVLTYFVDLVNTRDYLKTLQKINWKWNLNGSTVKLITFWTNWMRWRLRKLAALTKNASFVRATRLQCKLSHVLTKLSVARVLFAPFRPPWLKGSFLSDVCYVVPRS